METESSNENDGRRLLIGLKCLAIVHCMVSAVVWCYMNVILCFRRRNAAASANVIQGSAVAEKKKRSCNRLRCGCGPECQNLGEESKVEE